MAAVDRRVVLVDENGIPLSVTGGVLDTTGGGGGGSGGAVTIADGDDTTLGALADVAVVGDTAGSISAKLRGLSKILNDVWDDANNRLNVALTAAVPAGTNNIGDVDVLTLPAVTQGTSPWVISGAVTGSGTFTTAGAKTNNAAAPGATNVGSLSAIANAAAPTWTEGNLVGLSVDLTGNQRITGTVDTELPAAAALSDALANPTVPGVGAFELGWDSVNSLWKRKAIDANGNQKVTGGIATGSAVSGINPVLIGVQNSSANLTSLVANTAADTGSLTSMLKVDSMPSVYNGSSRDIVRSANTAAATTGTGLLGSGNLVWDSVNGVNWVKKAADASGRSIVVGAAAAGATPVGSPVYIAGKDVINTFATVPITTVAGRLIVTGGSDSGTVQTFLTAASLIDALAAPATMAQQTNPYSFNGTTWDRQRSANSAAATTGTGLFGSGGLNFDTTNWQKVAGDTSGRSIVVGAAAEGAATAGNPQLIAGLSANGSGNVRSPRVFTVGDAASTSTGISACSQTQVYNGSSWDMARGANTAAATTGTGLLGAGALVYDGTNWQALRNAQGADGTAANVAACGIMLRNSSTVYNAVQDINATGDSSTGTRSVATGLSMFNGTTYERQRTANAASNTTGTGVLSSGGMIFDGTNWQRITGDTSGRQILVHRTRSLTLGDGASNAPTVLADTGNNAISVQNLGMVFNGTTWDRMRDANTTAGTTGTGLLGSGKLVYDGTNWQKSVQASSMVGVQRVAHQYSFSNLAANATTTVKSGAGVLRAITINTKGITNTATIYDNTAGSGTKIATIDTTLGQSTLQFDIAFSTGCTVVLSGGTSADLTVAFA